MVPISCICVSVDAMRGGECCARAALSDPAQRAGLARAHRSDHSTCARRRRLHRRVLITAIGG